MDEVIIPVCNQVPDYVLGQGFWVRRQHILALVKSHAMFIFDSIISKVSGPVTENSQLSQCHSYY